MSLQAALSQIKERIQQIPRKGIREALQFQELTATRISEVVGKYAVIKESLSMTRYKYQNIALFEIHTAKREGIPRIIALPQSMEGVQEAIDKFHTIQEGPVYRISERTISAYCEEYFKDLTYGIEAYNLPTYYGEYKKIEKHQRRPTTHFLRHWRLTELSTIYGFDDIDLSIFAGWALRGMASRYVTVQWSRYIDKLLR